VAKVSTIISHENDQWVHFVAQHYLINQQVLQALGVLPSDSASQLTFRKRNGEEFTVTMTAGPPAALTSYFDRTPGFTPDYLQSAQRNYWFTYLPSARVLYFKYNACVESPDLSFAAFAQRLLAAIDQNPVDTLVIDFRGNTGGNGNQITPLVDGLQARLLQFVSNPRFQLYGVIDKGTFSSGMDIAEGFKQTVPGIDLSNVVHLIGEPTGGKPGSYGEVKSFILPNAGLAVNYSTVFHPAMFVPDGPSLMPDIAVPNRSADFFARHDPVLTAILGRTTIPPPPSGDIITVSAASFRVEQGLAPGSIAVAFGQFVGGVELRVNSQTAQIFGTTSSAIVFLVPESVTPGPAIISVRFRDAELSRGAATITATSPGIFILDGFDPSQPGAVENPDYSINDQAHPAQPGGFLQIYATGIGAGTPPLPKVFLGDVALEVVCSGVVGPG